jgi:hypothetical protein
MFRQPQDSSRSCAPQRLLPEQESKTLFLVRAPFSFLETRLQGPWIQEPFQRCPAGFHAARPL